MKKSIRATSGPCDRTTALRSLPESRDSRRSRALSSATMTRPRLQSDFSIGLLGAIDIMGMFVGTMTEFVAEWYKNRVLENAREEIREQVREEIREQVREEVRNQVREEVLQELREGGQDKTDAGEVN